MLSCVEGCDRTFTESAHLTKHKDACPLAAAFKAKVKQERRARGLQALLPKAGHQLTTRKERLQRQAQRGTSGATSSTSSSASTVNSNTPVFLSDSVPHTQSGQSAMDVDLHSPLDALDPHPDLQQPPPLTRSG
ncbi:hypothetical protein BJ165DRAFT_1616247 [Panaeolus papilionaceus]|nr:hypothetical protein BJ165DRAFT_1616247 [Panaeolus papilionaceus]